MRFEQRDGEPVVRQVGAAVVRADGRNVVVELGPADGPPITRLILSKAEATELGTALRRVIGGRDEAIILVDD